VERGDIEVGALAGPRADDPVDLVLAAGHHGRSLVSVKFLDINLLETAR
jgi:hypothetical protein